MSTDTNIDHEKVMALFGNVFNDVAGSIAIMMSYIGDQTGVYKAMDKLGSASVAAIAKEADVDEKMTLDHNLTNLLTIIGNNRQQNEIKF